MLLQCNAAPCALPAAITAAIPRTLSGLRLLQVSDLVKEDQELWRQKKGEQCPGLAEGHFTRSDSTEFAFALIDSRAHREAVVVARSSGGGGYAITVVSQPSVATNFLVIHVLPPGTYREVESRRRVKTEFDSIAYELIDAGMDMIYFRNNGFHTLALSE
jgi:hypothetical protein